MCLYVTMKLDVGCPNEKYMQHFRSITMFVLFLLMLIMKGLGGFWLVDRIFCFQIFFVVVVVVLRFGRTIGPAFVEVISRLFSLGSDLAMDKIICVHRILIPTIDMCLKKISIYSKKS